MGGFQQEGLLGVARRPGKGGVVEQLRIHQQRDVGAGQEGADRARQAADLGLHLVGGADGGLGAERRLDRLVVEPAVPVGQQQRKAAILELEKQGLAELGLPAEAGSHLFIGGVVEDGLVLETLMGQPGQQPAVEVVNGIEWHGVLL